jgi:hypothetical protein
MLIKNILTLKKKYIVSGLSLLVILLSVLLIINANNMKIIESNQSFNDHYNIDKYSISELEKMLQLLPGYTKDELDNKINEQETFINTAKLFMYDVRIKLTNNLDKKNLIENMECISNSYDNRNQKLDNKLCNASNSIEKRKDNLAK